MDINSRRNKSKRAQRGGNGARNTIHLWVKLTVKANDSYS